MKPSIALVLLLTVLNIASELKAQRTPGERTSIGFYNLENLYDTVPSLFSEDRDYTPSGKNSWGTTRYNRKLHNLGQVIDQMNLDILGVCEVENEAAIRDLVTSLHTDYNYIHRTSSDRRGMDLALLYKGDKFTPDKIRSINSSYGREFLYVRGRLLGQRVDLIVCHMPSNLNNSATRERVMNRLSTFVDSLRRDDVDTRAIVMGDFNANPTDRLMQRSWHTNNGMRHNHDKTNGVAFMFNPFFGLQRSGLGTYVFNDRWQLFDQLLIDNIFLRGDRLRYHSSAIYIQDYMLSDGLGLRRGYPKRTFGSGKYLGGYSDHLPVYIFLER